jgi:hypothetical protein
MVAFGLRGRGARLAGVGGVIWAFYWRDSGREGFPECVGKFLERARRSKDSGRSLKAVGRSFPGPVWGKRGAPGWRGENDSRGGARGFCGCVAGRPLTVRCGIMQL